MYRLTRRNQPLGARVYLLLSALLLTSLACVINLGGPAAPGPPIESSPQDAQDLIDLWSNSLALNPLEGEVYLLINEAQLTSFLAARLESSNQEAFIREPQVYLRDGQLQIYGIADQGPFEARVLISVTPRLDAEGSVGFAVTAADFGPFPAPMTFRDSLAAILTEAFTGGLGSLATGIRITSIAIADGQVAIVGQLR